MNYESLGRYTEASERLNALLSEREVYVSQLSRAANSMEVDLQNQRSAQTKFDHGKHTTNIELAMKNIKSLSEQITQLVAQINMFAADCGKEPKNIG